VVVFDRLLARIAVAAPRRCVLKGALALDFRLHDRGRTTKDIDFVHQKDEEAATEDLLKAQETDMRDFFNFAIERLTEPTGEVEGSAVRYRARAEVGGRLFEEVLIDIGFSDPLAWNPEVLRGPPLLAFAGIEPAEVAAQPLEQQVAEKVHAYTRTYGTGRTSSRVKDLVDIVLVKQSLRLQASRLREALETTFHARRQQGLPDRLPPPPGDWAVPFRSQAAQVGLDPDLQLAYREACDLVEPILGGQSGGHWDPLQARWTLLEERRYDSS
jgi:hypothetical protein